ncbi:MAG: ATP phosphoribosyltransferase regulatory subunit [archaeon]
MNTNTIKGFQDFIGSEANKRAKILDVIRNEFRLFGFEPAETPTIESVEFVRGENAGDEAVSEIFKLEDRGKRKLALKYESTFQLKRIARNQKLPYKVYQIARVFRDEPVKSNRLREFSQCDADVIGSSPKDEVEVLSMLKSIFEKLKIKPKFYINNKRLLNEILVSENIEEKNREQVLRELDKLDKLSKKEVADNLKKLGAEKLLKIFSGSEKNFEKYNFYKEIKELKKLARAYNLKLEFLPTLARGLSYYNGTIFEVETSSMKETICGGGAYLINDSQSFGFALGLDRISTVSGIEGENTCVLVVSVGRDDSAIRLAEKIRGEGISVNLMLDKSVGKALEYANAKNILKVVIIGDEESKLKKFKIKDMKSGKEILVDESDLVGKLG